MSELDLLQIFIKLSETLSFTEAANQLNTVQPVISRKIKVLEERLGIKLFYRQGKRISLTGDGVRLLDQIRHPVSSIEKVFTSSLQKGREDLEGLFVVGSIPEAGRNFLLPQFQELFKKYPNFSVDIRFMSTSEIHQSLLNQTIQIGLATQSINRSDFIDFKFSKDSFVLISHSQNVLNQSTVAVGGFKRKDLFQKKFFESHFMIKQQSKFQNRLFLNSYFDLAMAVEEKLIDVAIVPESTLRLSLSFRKLKILVKDEYLSQLFLIASKSFVNHNEGQVLWEYLCDHKY